MENNHLKISNNFLIQASVFLLPALISTLLFEIDEDLALLVEISMYRCGISGLFLTTFLSRTMPIHGGVASIVTVLIYFFVFCALYIFLFDDHEKRRSTFTYVNISLAILGILSGAFYMYAMR